MTRPRAQRYGARKESGGRLATGKGGDVSRWYLAGPMSGVPQFNYPAFDQAAAILRANGFSIASPAELDDPATRKAALASPDGAVIANGHTWGDFLARDVKLVADGVNGIIFLPGWERSRGARLEAFVGLLCGHGFMEYLGGVVQKRDAAWVRERLL